MISRLLKLSGAGGKSQQYSLETTQGFNAVKAVETLRDILLSPDDIAAASLSLFDEVGQMKAIGGLIHALGLTQGDSYALYEKQCTLESYTGNIHISSTSSYVSDSHDID